MQIEIDNNSGFCFGVKKTIEMADQSLKNGEPVYCLGEIVHNSEEVKRLESKGMITITHSDLKNITNANILVRAHGEPPSTYENLEQSNNILHEGTCPIVLKLQQKVVKAWNDAKTMNGQVVIFGKKGHAEVIGIQGQTNNEGIIISGIADLETIDFSRPVNLFAQTTMNPVEYDHIASEIYSRMQKVYQLNEVPFVRNNSICGHVSGRGEKLKVFAKKYDTIVFVSGKNSSNGKVLFDICHESNPNSYWVNDVESVQDEWFLNADKVGICGATSTPEWQMEQVAEKIRQIKK
jgi:4-hydroxy-3-methylbut-2-enyl diphosphate reductase